MKKPLNQGQQFLDVVEQALENNGRRPKGMPPLSEIEIELNRLGYGKTDAESVYDYWLGNGFKMGLSHVKDWRACIRNMVRYRRLPSQRLQPPGLAEYQRKKPAELEEARRDRLKSGYKPASEEECKRLGSALRQWRKSQ